MSKKLSNGAIILIAPIAFSRIAFSLAMLLLIGTPELIAKSEKRPYWNDIEVIRENTEAPRAWFIPYPDREGAISRNLEGNDYFRSLNGTWKFHYSDSPEGRPADFYQQKIRANFR